jgi:hypothetical protein
VRLYHVPVININTGREIFFALNKFNNQSINQ